MILAAGLSPAWQQILEFSQDIEPGQVNRANNALWCASGKCINAAIAAYYLGYPVQLVTALGGLSGSVIRDELEALEIPGRFIETEAATRVCTTLVSPGGNCTELVENTAAVSERVLADFIDSTRIYSNVADIVILSGSLPPNAVHETYAQIMRTTHKKFLLDFQGPALQVCLQFAPYLIKPNRQELAATLGQELNTEADLLKAMRKTNDSGPEWVVVSDGPNALYVTSDESAFKLIPPTVNARNTIGCGDSLAAGIAGSLTLHRDVVQSVRAGMAAAANNSENILPARLNAERVEELFDLIEIQELEIPL